MRYLGFRLGPTCPRHSDVRAIQFCGAERLFFKGKPIRSKA